MITRPMDVLEQFPVRKSNKQKQRFRDAVQTYAKELGYASKVEKGSFSSHNIVIGDPENAKYLITAHYDTCTRMIVSNLITPCNLFLFILYKMFVAVLLLAPAIALGILVGVLAKDPNLGQLVCFLLLFLNIYLLIFGPANRHNANNNTSGVVTLLEIAKTLPKAQRSKVCFVLFDLEEAGLIGSASYRQAHKKASQNQIVLNLDCVGDGDEIMFFPTKKLKQDENKLVLLRKCATKLGTKNVSIQEKGFAVYPSDQANFPYGAGICALHKSRFGLYLGRIHTKRDTILEETNVNILRAALISMITCDAVQ